ncbi:HNH endonuclease signature motif containing protein [Pseudokineococcus marinus]|uniref:HNH endonuclease n=1 Tax=Pseudokineococcus marinus TaxID=351215 RepID=A0A849BMN0_9ACTN|nr:HNH endonuclease [Pseudokineococcus marinus]
MALSSLLGLDDDPAQHPTLGPVPAMAVAELLAAGHRFRRALTAPLTGHLVGLDGHLLTLDPTTTAATTTAGCSTTAPPDPPRGRPRTAPARRGPRAAITVRVDTPDDLTPSPTTSPAPDMTAAAAAPPLSPPGPVTGPSPTSPHASLRRAARRPGCSYAALTGGPGPYAPTEGCARWVRTRSPRCQAPGCRMPATRCDLDHRVSHATGGPTCPCNLDVLCRRHHLAKHHHGWTAVPMTDDARDPGLTWTTPLGQVVQVPAHPLLPRPAPPAADGVRAKTDALDAAAAALEERLLGPARYPHRDSAAHDLDRVHAERARQQQELRRRHGGDGGRSPSGRGSAAAATSSPSTAASEVDEAPAHQHDSWGDGEPPY